MAEVRVRKVEQGQTKIRNVPIAVTPEGFWCCPSPVVFQKTQKTQNPQNKPKSSPTTQTTSVQKKQTLVNEKRPETSSSRTSLVTDDPVLNSSLMNEEIPRPKIENAPKKVAIEFGEAGTSDLKVILLGKQGVAVKLSVHRSILVNNSSFFANKIVEKQPVFPFLEIEECEDVEIYVETIGLMYYSKEMKQRLIKQSVSRVLRILKAAEKLGFKTCIQSCLEYLEAVPWVGEEEEEKVVSSILHLKDNTITTKPVLKRVSSQIPTPPNDTLSHILELVLKSNEEKGRREMKSIVLKLLKENNTTLASSSHLHNETLYTSCRASLNSLLSLFRQAAEPDPSDNLVKSMALEADNLLWLLDILSDRQSADEFAVIWANQRELALLHPKIPIRARHHVSVITARVFVGIGRGEILPCKDTRHSLLQTWLEALINDYRWLQYGCRSFDRKVVEEGIGRTILTLPLEDQQSFLLSWLGNFLKHGDNCPNLQRAFEVWWRRTFIRPYVEPTILLQTDGVMATKVEQQ